MPARAAGRLAGRSVHPCAEARPAGPSRAARPQRLAAGVQPRHQAPQRLPEEQQGGNQQKQPESRLSHGSRRQRRAHRRGQRAKSRVGRQPSQMIRQQQAAADPLPLAQPGGGRRAMRSATWPSTKPRTSARSASRCRPRRPGTGRGKRPPAHGAVRHSEARSSRLPASYPAHDACQCRSELTLIQINDPLTPHAAVSRDPYRSVPWKSSQATSSSAC